MTRISYPSSAPAWSRRAELIVVIGTRSALSGARPPAWLAADAWRACAAAAEWARIGDLGGVAYGTLPGPAPRGKAERAKGQAPVRLALGVLRDEYSRHNSPMRAEAIRSVFGRIARDLPAATAVLLLLDDERHAAPAASAVARLLPLYSAKSSRKARAVAIACAGPDGAPVRLDSVAKSTVEAVRRAAELVDRPPSELHPAAFARAASSWLKGAAHVKISEIRGDALLRAGLGGIHGVGRAASEAPRMVVMTYAPPRAKGPHVALVGKGITYDTGGLHLKARGAMEGMKGDMGGAAATLGAFRVLVDAKLARRVSLVLCMAENAVGPKSYKPDDVLTMHSGKTVEINNTDAEGRLLLADGVSYAVRVLGADVVIDAATLTGAQMIATGLVHAAVISNGEELEQAAVAAGRRAGELVHPLPFAPELYKSEFSSPIADMRNSVKNRSNAQSSCAAQFVYWHIEDTPARWLHIDLAGPASREDRGTGFGVGLIAELVRSL